MEAHMRAKLLLHELKHVVAIETTEQGTSNFKAMAKTLLAVNQTQHSVSNMAPGTTRFGLTPDSVRETWGVDDTEKLGMMKEAMRVLLPPDIESRLEAKCRLICNFVYPQNDANGACLAFSHVHQLPKELSELRDNVAEMAAERYTIEAACDQGQIEYIRLLTEISKHLVAIIKVHKIDMYTQYTRPKVEFLQACVSALQRKIELMTKQLLVETYSVKKLQALSSLRQLLEERHRQATATRAELLAALRARDSTDDLLDIRQDYARTQHGILKARTALAKTRDESMSSRTD
ncbi:hypothetical protein Ae201684P_001646 [Aphanomyces euteiches]|uniref:Uncharacterized protein n=1 Tax=Aphanomyces euteiches TaxID=100861 RepID=A0A6G0X9M2_9STRA|nr:hypothetical protein Ae201684_007121 [Aphanomyces euteiches]KAH9052466.1 hypothetical protein Ae201684P_001646 [Aphanomyces euteiches]